MLPLQIQAQHDILVITNSNYGLLIRMISIVCLKIIKHPLFETASIGVILANSLMLLFSDPTSASDDPLLIQLEEIFLILYTIEMSLKIFAMGFVCVRKAYLRDPWNVLDFVIVTTAYLPYIFDGQSVNLKSLRFMRILRPLRTITSIRALKIIMLALLSAMPMLCDSFTIVIFIFLVFGIGGLQLFQGLLKQHCFHPLYGIMHPDEIVCGNYDCPDEFTCGKTMENPNYGVSNFDNILYSFLQVFLVTTLEGWTEIMTYVQKAFSEFTVVYFVVLIFIGAFFLLNIILAVIKAKFSDVQSEQNKQDELEARKFDSHAEREVYLYNRYLEKHCNRIKDDEFYFRLRCLKTDAEFYKHFHRRKYLLLQKSRLSKVYQEVDLNNSDSINNSQDVLLQQGQYEYKPTVVRQLPPINKKSQFVLAIQKQSDQSKGLLYKNSASQPKQKLISAFSEQHPINGSPRMVTHRDELEPTHKTETEVDRQLFKGDEDYEEAKNNLIKNCKKDELKIIVEYGRSEWVSTSQFDILKSERVKKVQRENIRYMVRYPEYDESEEQQQVNNRSVSKFVSFDSNVTRCSMRIPIKSKVMNYSLSVHKMPPIARMEKVPEKKMEFVTEDDILNPIFVIQQINRDESCLLNRYHIPNYALIYDQVLHNDYESRAKVHLTWSGYDVTPWNPKRTNKVTRSINYQNAVIWVSGVLGLILVLRNRTLLLIQSKAFENFIIVTVICNTTTLAVQSFYDDSDVFLIFNYIYTVIFTIEMALKIFAYKFKGYLQDGLNILDGLIVIISLVEIFFLTGNSAASAFKTFRTFRVLRVTKLFKALEFMKIIILVVSKSLSSFIYIALLLFIFIFIYSLLGRQLYAGQLDFEPVLRSNFDSNAQAFITVFQILTLENWQQILYSAIRSSTGPFITCMYLISWIFVGNYILLNLFLAILLDGFTSEELEEGEEEERVVMKVWEQEGWLVEKEKEKEKGENPKGDKVDTRVERQKSLPLPVEKSSPVKASKAVSSSQMQLHLAEDDEKEEEAREEERRRAAYSAMLCEESLFLFGKDNPIRRLSYAVVSFKHFESIILALIVLSSLKLVFDTYLPESADTPSQKQLIEVSNGIDYFFNACFTLEMLTKVISQGLFVEQDTYLRDFWNILDCFIVCSSLIDMSFEGVDLAAVKILRLLRTLRPLRFVSHNVNMKIVVNALLQSVGAILNVLIVVCLIWLMFAILGTALFQNRMGYCDADPYFSIPRHNCTRTWLIHRNNFEHVGNASLTLFVVSTLEGWPDYMYQAIDSNFPQYGPQINQNLSYSLFYILFILIGSFFLLNLFVGALCYNFDKAQKAEKMFGLMTSEQAKWIEMHRLINKAKPDIIKDWVPKQGIRLPVYNFVTSNSFEIGIMVIIFLNIVLMALSYEGSSKQYQNVIEYINYVFTGIFIFEMVIKIVAMTFLGYLSSGWNQFDFFIVMASIIDIMVLLIGGSSILAFAPSLIRIIRVFRITRILRLVKSLKGLQKLIETILISLPSLLNVGALLFLVMFIYSILGCFLFKAIRKGEMVNDIYNFRTFSNSILFLFRCLTGEDWPMVMYDLMRTDSSCEPNLDCGTTMAIPFFISFQLICNFIMLNLFILIVLQDFEEYNLKKDNPLEEFKDNLDKFKTQFLVFSQEHKGVRIHKKHLKPLLVNLDPPLGVGSNNEQLLAQKCINLDLREDENHCLYFNDVFYELMKSAYGASFNESENQKIVMSILNQELEAKKQMQEQKKQIYAKVLQKNNIQQNKLNPFFLMIFIKTAFLCWKRYSDNYRHFMRARKTIIANQDLTQHQLKELFIQEQSRQVSLVSEDSEDSDSSSSQPDKFDEDSSEVEEIKEDVIEENLVTQPKQIVERLHAQKSSASLLSLSPTIFKNTDPQQSNNTDPQQQNNDFEIVRNNLLVRMNFAPSSSPNQQKEGLVVSSYQEKLKKNKEKKIAQISKVYGKQD